MIRRVREPLHERQIEALRKSVRNKHILRLSGHERFHPESRHKRRAEGGDGEAGPNPSWQDRKAVATLYFRPSDAVTSDRFIL